MENAAEAIKLAGFTLIFVIALTIAMITVMQSKTVSEKIIRYSDKTYYTSDIKEDTTNFDENNNRIVSKYDIIPTLYRYKQEGYIVLFKNADGSPLKIFDKESNKIGGEISYLNYNLEDLCQEEWRQNNETVRNHVDEVIKNILENNNIDKFVETLSYTNYKFEGVEKNDITNLTSDTDLKEDEIRVITYTVKNN